MALLQYRTERGLDTSTGLALLRQGWCQEVRNRSLDGGARSIDTAYRLSPASDFAAPLLLPFEIAGQVLPPTTPALYAAMGEAVSIAADSLAARRLRRGLRDLASW